MKNIRDILESKPKIFRNKRESMGHNSNIQTQGGTAMNKNKPKNMFEEMMDKVKKMMKKMK